MSMLRVFEFELERECLRAVFLSAALFLEPQPSKAPKTW